MGRWLRFGVVEHVCNTRCECEAVAGEWHQFVDAIYLHFDVFGEWVLFGRLCFGCRRFWRRFD